MCARAFTAVILTIRAGLPRANSALDDPLLAQLGIREAHYLELQVGLAQRQADWISDQ